MYTLYNVNNNKESNIKGFWIDKYNKLHIDNIHISYDVKYPKIKINNMFKNKENCIFYKYSIRKYISDEEKQVAYILDNKGNKETLNNCIIKIYSIYEDIDNIIIDYLLKYEGIIVHYIDKDVIIEIWSQ